MAHIASLTSQAFEVPTDGPTYVEQVRSRCYDLITSGIWSGLHVSNLNQWWSNFDGEIERYFAACLLDTVIYRSEDQTIALMRQLVQRSLPDLERATSGIIDWEDRLLYSSGKDSKVRLVPVLPPSAATSKSAHVISRLYEKKLGVPACLFARADEIGSLIGNGVEAIVFIDDLLGTGTQFVTEFAAHYNLDQFGTAASLIYAPLIAHRRGVDFIQKKMTNIHVASAESLDETHAIFAAEGRAFADGVNSPQAAWDLYSNILATRGVKLSGSSRRGFGELELAIFFSHAAPDNCLPIFWWNKSRNWKPLFPR